MQLDCTKGQKHSSAFWLSPLESLSCRALTHSHPTPLTHLLLSEHFFLICLSLSLFLSQFQTSLSPLSLAKPDIATATCKLTDAHAHGTYTHARARETCYLATQGWDRCRPISVGSERAVNEERGPIDGRVLLHNNLKRGEFNHSLTFRIRVWPNSHVLLQSLAHICWHTFVNKCVGTDIVYCLALKFGKKILWQMTSGTIVHQNNNISLHHWIHRWNWT